VAADRIEQRRLACAVRTGDTERLSCGHPERKVVDRRQTAVPLGQAHDLE
jgi:hypothetical protein